MIENIKILVGYHEPAPVLRDSILTPINAGRALVDKRSYNYTWLKENTIGDDSGENISKRNKSYNELTAIYWAWKNQAELGEPDAIQKTFNS